MTVPADPRLSEGGPGEFDLLDRLRPAELALRLASKPAGLPSRIIHELLAEPKRYSELKPLLGERHDNNLTVALRQLAQQGLIVQRPDYSGPTPSRAYALSALGVETVLAIHALRPQAEMLAGLKEQLVAEIREFMEGLKASLRPAPADFSRILVGSPATKAGIVKDVEIVPMQAGVIRGIPSTGMARVQDMQTSHSRMHYRAKAGKKLPGRLGRLGPNINLVVREANSEEGTKKSQPSRPGKAARSGSRKKK